MTQTTDKELLQLISGCIKADVKCQKMLYQEFYGPCMGICMRYAPNRDEAAQILNRGFLMAFTKIGNYSGTQSFKAWITRLMIIAAIDFYRAGPKIAHIRDAVVAERIDDETLPDKYPDHQTLLTMLQGLSNNCRIVFNLFVMERYSHEEIGSMLNISPEMSRSHLGKARNHLRQMIFETSSPGSCGKIKTNRCAGCQFKCAAAQKYRYQI